MDKKKKKSAVVTWIVVVLLVVGVVGGYFLLRAGKDSENYESEELLAESEKLIARNLETDYPATPREVIKFYSRIMKCYYDEGLEEEKVAALGDQMRLLLDEELLESNPRDDFFAALDLEIKDYAESKRKVTNYQIESSDNVVEWTDADRDYARLVAHYTLKEDKQYLEVYEEFLLRRDDAGKWRILGWQLADKEDMD